MNASSEGVHPVINNFETTLDLYENDLSLRTRAAFPVYFGRSYRNPSGFHRSTFSGSGNVIGESWSNVLPDSSHLFVGCGLCGRSAGSRGE
ncbi:MAG: hypothetical protein WCQ89_20730, partial [Verrucomicrobiota bacterium]